MTPESDRIYSRLPERYREGMKRYIEEHIAPGSFLRAMLENDLQRVMAHIDPEMLGALRSIYLWIYNEAPAACWGSPEKVKAWVERENRC